MSLSQVPYLTASWNNHSSKKQTLPSQRSCYKGINVSYHFVHLHSVLILIRITWTALSRWWQPPSWLKLSLRLHIFKSSYLQQILQYICMCATANTTLTSSTTEMKLTNVWSSSGNKIRWTNWPELGQAGSLSFCVSTSLHVVYADPEDNPAQEKVSIQESFQQISPNNIKLKWTSFWNIYQQNLTPKFVSAHLKSRNENITGQYCRTHFL